MGFALLLAIADYYALRERAAVSGDLTELSAAYPDLARMRQRAIARLSHELESYQGIGV